MGDCFKSAGPIISREISISGFNKIEVFDNINVLLVPSGKEKVIITAGENLVPLIKVRNDNGKLELRNGNKCNWVRSFSNRIDAEVHITALDHVIHQGTGDIKSGDTIYANLLTIDLWNSGNAELLINAGTSNCNIHSGVGDITVKGLSGVSYVYAVGSGFVYGDDLATGYTFIRNAGTGDCYINAEKEIGAEIRHVGNIYYSGNPARLVTDITGSGKIIRK